MELICLLETERACASVYYTDIAMLLPLLQSILLIMLALLQAFKTSQSWQDTKRGGKTQGEKSEGVIAAGKGAPGKSYQLSATGCLNISLHDDSDIICILLLSVS